MVNYPTKMPLLKSLSFAAKSTGIEKKHLELLPHGNTERVTAKKKILLLLLPAVHLAAPPPSVGLSNP